MWGAIMSLVRDFRSNEDGHFAIMFSIASAMVLLGTAVAIDLAGMQSAQAGMQNHIDSATLAAVVDISHRDDYAETFELDDAQRSEAYQEIVAKSLEAHGVDMFGASPNVTVANGKLMVDATIPYELQFGGVLNKPTVNLFAKTEVALPGIVQDNLEIALVLDNAGSMNFDGRMPALKTAVRKFINAIEDGETESKVALVPFARYVDIGEDKRGEFWLNVPAEFDTVRTIQQATHTGGDCHTEIQTRYKDGELEEFETLVCTNQTTTYEPVDKVIESRWIGCVGVRSDGLHMVDDSYLTEATRIQGLINITPGEATGFNVNEASWCPRTVEPLTDDYDKLRGRIGSLVGIDKTYIPAGLIWGKRILSPQAPFTESTMGQRNGTTRQVMVLMSDGKNTGYLEDIDDHESIPYVQDLTQEEQADGVRPPNSDEETALLCETIKAEGTEIYTIAFKVEDEFTHSLLRNCASSPSNYYQAESNESLISSFSNISESLETKIRLVR